MRGFRSGQGGSRKAGARAIGKRGGGGIKAASSFKLAAPRIHHSTLQAAAGRFRGGCPKAKETLAQDFQEPQALITE